MVTAVIGWRTCHDVTWDACSTFVQGAEGAGWESLLGLEPTNLAKAFENVQITVVGYWAVYCGFHGYIAHA